MLVCAPEARRTLTTSVWPLLEARTRAVRPRCEEKDVVECKQKLKMIVVAKQTKQLLTIVIERILILYVVGCMCVHLSLKDACFPMHALTTYHKCIIWD